MLSINNILKYKFFMDCSCGMKENLPSKKLASVLAIGHHQKRLDITLL